MDYYEQPSFKPVVLATYTKDNMTAELTQLDQDGEYFSSDVYTVDSDGYTQYQNNSGSVNNFQEAFGLFELDLDCFFWGVEFDESMKTENFPTN